MFHFRKGKQKTQEEIKSSQTGYYQGEQNRNIAPPTYTNAAPTADELFERTMAPSLSPSAFMERQSGFTEPTIVPKEEKLVGQTEPLKPVAEPDITSWQKQEQEEQSITERISKPAFSEDEISKATEPASNTRILKFVGNNGGPIFYHSRMEEK